MQATRAAFAMFCLLASASPLSGQRGMPPTPLVTFTGTLRQIDRKIIAIETADGNILQFHCTRKTIFLDGSEKVKPASFKLSDRISVEAKAAPDETLDAVIVRLDRKK